METVSLIPTPDTIPISWGWFKALLLLTFTIHLLLVNVIVGGGLHASYSLLKKQSTPGDVSSLPTLIALTINFGIPPLLFLQVLYGNLFYTSSILMAVYWIMVIPVLLIAYYSAYLYSKRISANQSAGNFTGVSVIIMTISLLVIGFLFVNNITLMLSPDKFKMQVQHPGGTFLHLSEPSLFPRYLHYLLASIAVTGLARSVYCWFKGGKCQESSAGIHRGLKIFGWASIGQLIVGPLFWITLPSRVGRLFLGDHLVYSLHLWAAILLALTSIVLSFHKKLWATVATALGTVFLMVVVRDFVRSAMLETHFNPGNLTVISEYSPFIAFLVVLLLGACIIFYMLKLFRHSGKRSDVG